VLEATKRRLGLALLAVSAALGALHLSGRGVSDAPQLRAAVLDIDSRVALAPLARCEPRVASVEAIASGRGPRLDAGARFVWFEAAGPDGRRQVQRFDRTSRAVTCLTCGEPGNNRRPAPHPTARAVVFDTDRFASWQRPFDRELMVLATEGPARPSRRLSWDAASDTHPLYDPSGLGVVWSRAALGVKLVRARIRIGHGSLSLSEPLAIVGGGLAPIAASAWSADGRALALGSGFAFAAHAELVDLGTGAREPLPAASAFHGSVSFSADGSQLVRAERGRDGSGWRVLLGERGGALREVLGTDGRDVPTGIALAPDARGFALGMQRGAEEWIDWVALACEPQPAP
jgi:hypothetical protein